MKKTLKQRMGGCIRGTALIACFIAIWYIASCFTQPIFIPSPIVVWDAIIGLAETGQLQMGLLYSFLRITGASAISMAVAIPLALLIYGVKPVKETLMPIVSFLRYIPVTAFSPLLILWFGIGEQMKISFLFIATFVYLLPSILLCFNDVPQDLMDTGKTIGMTNWETIKEILLPASLPSIFSTFLMMYGIGWTYCAVVEATNAKYGYRKASMTLFDSQYLTPLADKYSSATTNSESAELTEEQKQEIVDYEALLTKSMTVEFVADTAQFKNPDEAYAIMDEFVTIANTLDGAIIQVEGNINARNYTDSGQALSAERAKAVAKYFIACGIDPNRLITVGNGNTKMLVDPGASDAYLNRRTDVFFKIIEE